MTRGKRYDRAYFDKWYRSEDKVIIGSEVRRKVALAVSLTEYFLKRPLKSVLDIGCGEAAWLPHLRALRPKVQYLGLDPSEYVVRRYGKARNIRKASFTDFATMELDDSYDLVICADALHYVPTDDIPAGVKAMAAACGGLAYVEVLTQEDDVIGDLDGLEQRPAAFYRRLFKRNGFTSIGPFAWLSPAVLEVAAEMELPG
jgi:SAM-dependent methyltransferase